MKPAATPPHKETIKTIGIVISPNPSRCFQGWLCINHSHFGHIPSSTSQRLPVAASLGADDLADVLLWVEVPRRNHIVFVLGALQ